MARQSPEGREGRRRLESPCDLSCPFGAIVVLIAFVRHPAPGHLGPERVVCEARYQMHMELATEIADIRDVQPYRLEQLLEDFASQGQFVHKLHPVV